MAIHCSIFAWEIRWTEEPGGLQSMRSNLTKQARKMVRRILTQDLAFGGFGGLGLSLTSLSKHIYHLNVYHDK